jgi:1,4-alpha-glucan branching enzyme
MKNKVTNSTVPESEINRIVHGDHSEPFGILGMHPISTAKGQRIAIRAFVPGAISVRALDGKADTFDLEQVHALGFFEGTAGERREMFPYRLEIVFPDETRVVHDPFAFPPLLSDFDLHLFSEGNHHSVYEKLGAHVTDVQGVAGVIFAVWAPNARRVSVVGDFNNWDGRRMPMRRRGQFGVWEIFLPGLHNETLYKYEVKTMDGNVVLKGDPYASRMELRPQTASIIHTLSDAEWTDEDWISRRKTFDPTTSPISIYEVHLGSWERNPDSGDPLDYRQIAHRLVDYVNRMGYTHVELLPIMEHPLDESWGYQVLGYYAPTSRYGSPEDFQYFVDTCHANDIGVILDWVPGHFPNDSHGLANFDGTALFEHADTRKGMHPDWGTLIFNFSRNEVRNFLTANAIFWLEKYHLDGLRVDAVASMLYLDYSREKGEWVPNRYGGRENLEAVSFLKELNKVVYSRFPGVMMCAEESTTWPGVTRPVYLGGLGFGFKWNMGWMNDMLDYMSLDPVYRKYDHNKLTFTRVYAFSENFILVLSHDEVVHGKRSLLSKMPGDRWQKFANLRTFYGYMYGHPGKKLLFMGGEFGQLNEWDSSKSLDWHLADEDLHGQLQTYVKDLNSIYRSESALYKSDGESDGFEWIDCHDADQGTIAFIRRDTQSGSTLVFVCNFTPVPRHPYRIGVPDAGFYREVLNSDSDVYGGSNQGNWGGVTTQEIACHGHPLSLEMVLPPLTCLVLKCDGIVEQPD